MVTTMQRAPMTEHGTTSSLIASDRVEGTAVNDAHGKRIGKVATAHISLTECPIGPHQRRKSGHAGRVAARTRLG
jgi:hypothetical protein